MGTVRYELFFKSQHELKLALASTRARAPLARVNLPNKDKSDDLIGWLDACAEAGCEPGLVTPHFSMKNNSSRDAEATVRALKSFSVTCANKGVKEILLVTGSGKRKMDSLEALRRLKMDRGWKRETIERGLKFGVAYNPYFQEAGELEEENDRLAKKLGTELVRSVWFQIGSEVDALDRGLARVREMAPDDIELFCSVWIPTKQLLARMKFRPWKGVFLSDEYLSSVEKAEKITREQIQLCTKYGANVLVESPVTKDADWTSGQRLLSSFEAFEEPVSKKVKIDEKSSSL